MATLGWGRIDAIIKGVTEPLWARAMVVRDPASGETFAYACVDLLLVSVAVRERVIERLQRERPEMGLDAARVILTATHTHSGPSGFSHYFWINLAAPGYSEPVFRAISDGIFDAIVTAFERRKRARLTLREAVMSCDEGVVFNRSWFAYSRNHDAEAVPYERRCEATDRTMTMLSAETEDGTPIGDLNWFALHGTCVHSDHDGLHPDHKGLAAAAFDAERRPENPDYVSVFAQEATGDVSPNYRYSDARRFVIGRFDDDLDSAAFVAEAEVRLARQLLRGPGRAIAGGIGAVAPNIDFSMGIAAAEYTIDGSEHTTTPARLGLSMAQGTVEGPGPLLRANRRVRGLTRTRALFERAGGLIPGRVRSHDPKVPLLDLGRGPDGRFVGLIPLRRLAFAARADQAVAYVNRMVVNGAVGQQPWIAQVIPVQLVRLGPLAIAATPFEMTTVAGRRLRATILDALAPHGVETVIINSYANGYSGYLTTYEEYQCQHYEAGYTLFGPWSLAALRTAYAEAAADMAAGRERRGVETDRFPAAELMARSFGPEVAWKQRP